MSRSAPEASIVTRSVELARDMAPLLQSVLLTIYPDADTLDTLGLVQCDLPTAAAISRSVGAALAEQGVEVIVQRADRAAFRRWMQDREDTLDNRRSWIDRARLVRGVDALRMLGVDPLIVPPPTKYGKAPGSAADRLLTAFEDEDGEKFADFAGGLLDDGRNDVLDLAVRKIAERQGDEAADELEGALLAVAEGGAFGPSGWAELVTLPVALPARDLPDALSLAKSFLSCGFVDEDDEIRFLPGWRSPEALDDLSPTAIRRVLRDLVAGTEPSDLPPGDTDDLAKQGFGFLLGLRIDWAIPVWDKIAAGGSPEEPDDEAETPEEARRNGLFERWRGEAFATLEGCVPLDLVPPSEVGTEIAEFLTEAGERTGGIDEIRDFVSIARDEAGVEEVVCRLEVIGAGMELSLYTSSGRYLDSLKLAADRMPASPDDMVQFIGSFVRVVKDQPQG